MNEIEKFINENESAFEFIVDYKNIEDYWEIDFDEKCINVLECCIVYIRENDDEGLENWFKEDNLINKKVKKDNYILYIVM
jgi:hypothetical protein